LESYGAYHFLINKFQSKFLDSVNSNDEAHCDNGDNEDSHEEFESTGRFEFIEGLDQL